MFFILCAGDKASQEKDIVKAKGWSVLSRETELSRSAHYAALSGETDPKIGTVMKILKALGVRVISNIVPFQEDHVYLEKTAALTGRGD